MSDDSSQSNNVVRREGTVTWVIFARGEHADRSVVDADVVQKQLVLREIFGACRDIRTSHLFQKNFTFTFNHQQHGMVSRHAIRLVGDIMADLGFYAGQYGIETGDRILTLSIPVSQFRMCQQRIIDAVAAATQQPTAPQR